MHFIKQECIPVGCITTVAVAATRYHYRACGGGADPSMQILQMHTSCRQTLLDADPLPPVDRMTDRCFWKHCLPFWSEIKLCNGDALSSNDLLTFIPLIPFEMSTLHSLAVSQCIFDAIRYDSFGINNRQMVWTLKSPMFLTLIFGKDWEVPVSRCLPKTGSFTKTTTNIPASPPKKMNQIVW